MVLDDAVELFRIGAGPGRVRVEVEDAVWRLGPELAELREAWHARHPSERSDRRMGLERAERAADGSLHFRLRVTEWAEVRAWQATLPESHAALAHQLRFQPGQSVTFAVPNFLVVHAVLETADAAVIAAQRATALHYYPGAWSVSFEEGLEPVDGAGDDCFAVCALRGLREEFRLPEAVVAACSVELRALVLESAWLSPALVVIVRAPLSARELLAVLPDAGEVAAVRAVPLEADALRKFGRGLGDARCHPTARYRIFTLAASRHREEEAALLIAQAFDLKS